jgi:hypothetical protein
VALVADFSWTLVAPWRPQGAFDRGAHAGFVVGEFFLLFGGELEHGPGLAPVAESGEDFAAHAEVGMVHVGALFGSGEGEGQLAEFFGGYRQGFLSLGQ